MIRRIRTALLQQVALSFSAFSLLSLVSELESACPFAFVCLGSVVWSVSVMVYFVSPALWPVFGMEIVSVFTWYSPKKNRSFISFQKIIFKLNTENMFNK